MTTGTWRRIAGLGALAVVATVLIVPQLAKGGGAQTGALPAATPNGGQAAAIATTLSVHGTAEATPTPESVQERIAFLEGQVREEPDDAEALTELGGLFFQLRLYPRAADYFARVLELEPENARVRTDLGTALLYQGMVLLARREFERAIETDAALPDPHFNLAVTLSHNDPPDIERALEEWRKVIEIAPDSDLATTSRQYLEAYAEQAPPGDGEAPPGGGDASHT